jgi:hypothetical protein
MKLNDWKEVLENVNKALEIDGYNTKALYRRAVAYSRRYAHMLRAILCICFAVLLRRCSTERLRAAGTTKWR